MDVRRSGASHNPPSHQRGVTVKRILVSALLLALLSPAAVAQAAPVQEFNVQLKDVKPDGRYTIVFTANSFDTSGEPPPLLTSNTVRFAAGVNIRKEFKTSAYKCDVGKLRDALIAAPEGGYFFKRLDNLPATYKRVKARMTPESRKVTETCIRSQIGSGSVVVDARTLGLPDPLPAKLYLYLAKPAVKGAFASFGIFAVLDEAAPAIQSLGSLATLKLVFSTDLFNEPSADGLYGVKMVLPTGSGLRISVAELKVTTPGITKTTVKKTCLTKRKGKCVKSRSQVNRLFWLTQPACPASGQVSFRSDYGYETGLATERTIQVPCPRFQQ
jgi:hypothetical protein